MGRRESIRRNLRRSDRGAYELSPPAIIEHVALVPGGTGFSYVTADNEGPVGTVTMTRGWTGRVPSGLSSASRILVGSGTLTQAAGCRIYITGSSEITVFARVGSGAPATITTAGYILPELDKDYALSCTLSGGFLQLFVQGYPAGVPVAVTGYTEIPTPRFAMCGGTTSATGSTDVGTYGCTALDGTALSTAQMLEWVSDCQSASNGIADFQSATNTWDVADLTSVGASLPDTVSAVDMDKGGASAGTIETYTADWATITPSVGIGSFSDSNHWKGDDDEAPLGSSAFTVAMVFRIDTAFNASEFMAAHSDGTTTTHGWDLYGTTSNRIGGVAFDGSGALVATSVHTFLAGDVGKCQRAVMTTNGTTVQLYVNGSIVGTPAACVGYTAPTSVATTIGARDNTTMSACDNFTIISMITANDVMDAGEIATWDAAVVEAVSGGVPALTGVTEETRWDASTASTLPSQWIDSIAGINLDRQGTGGTVSLFLPAWS